MNKLMTTIYAHLHAKEMLPLKNILNDLEIFELIEVFNELMAEERVILFRLLSKDLALELFESLDAGLQQQLLASFTEERVKEFLNEMAPDDRVRLFDELPAKVTSRLIQHLSDEEKQETALLMGFAPETAGRIMTTEYIRLNKTMTAEDALLRIKDMASEKESIYTLYVTDENKVLEGVLSFKELFLADPKEVVAKIMTEKVAFVTTDTDQEEVAHMLQDFDLLSLPVVDSEKRLVGMITVDDAMDIVEEETTEDIFEKAGLLDLGKKEHDRSNVLINGSLLSIWAVRIPFLLITMIGGLLAGGVVDFFDDALSSVTAIAIFIPVIMDMGGNAGTQSSTIFGRALVLGQIHPKLFLKHFAKETFVGFSMGILIGITTGVVAYFWQGLVGLSIAVGLSLVLTMTLATALGFSIPYLLFKVGLDQAAGSDPIITTIKDISGLLIYFLLVSQFLSHLL